MELVSVIIPHYNSSILIKETLFSIFNQSYSNIEVIVVDDGSSFSELNNLYSYQEFWSSLKIYRRPNELVKGANSCRNYGLELSSGHFVNFVDADDLLSVNKIKSQVEALLINRSLGMVVCKTAYFKDTIGNIIRLLQYEDYNSDSDFLYKYISRSAVWCTNSALIRRSEIGDIRFKEGQVDAHEWLFFIRLMLKKIKVSAINEVFVYKRVHPGAIGRYNINIKLPSLLESRKIVYQELFYSDFSNRSEYLKVLIYDINSLLRTTAKQGLFSLYLDFIKFFDLNIYLKCKAYLLFFFFFLSKRGYRINVIPLNEKNFNISRIY